MNELKIELSRRTLLAIVGSLCGFVVLAIIDRVAAITLLIGVCMGYAVRPNVEPHLKGIFKNKDKERIRELEEKIAKLEGAKQ